jgi:hypothetical protein
LASADKDVTLSADRKQELLCGQTNKQTNKQTYQPTDQLTNQKLTKGGVLNKPTYIVKHFLVDLFVL